ncbi:MAG: hypothetical protein KF723_22255 [Rhizobiaceae bacterium]|nr:hypothetical protein [Rhizobiaceae bacterium]
MTDNDNGPKPLLGGVTLATAIQIFTIIGGIIGAAAVLNDRVSDLRKAVSDLADTARANRADITSLQVRMSVLEQKHEALREIVIELRRQSGLRSPAPSP